MITVAEQGGAPAALYTCTLEVFGWNLDQGTGYPN